MKQSQDRSIYSLNSQKSGLVYNSNNVNTKTINQLNSSVPTNSLNDLSPLSDPNQLHSLYYQLLEEYSQQYPYLSKVLYLQLLLRENVLLVSNGRQEIRQIWKAICKRLMQYRPNIFVVDPSTQIDQILNIKSDYNLALVFDISKLNNFGLNKLLNHDSELSFLVVQSFQSNSEKNLTNQELKGLFSACFVDQKQQNFHQMIRKLNIKPTHNIFSKDRFHQMIRHNFQIAVQTQNDSQYVKGQTAFLKPYLIILKYHLQALKINVAHSKWKKMAKILQFIAVSKHQGFYKKMSLADCCFTPNLLASSKKQLQTMSRANQLAILQIMNYYGKNRFVSNLQGHFWVSDNVKKHYSQLVQKVVNRVTFFYACSKFSQTATIQTQNNKAFYRIKGFQKKLMSDKHIQLQDQENSQYEIYLVYRSKSKVVVHFGVACFDQLKNIISPLQVCRRENSRLNIKSIQANRIYPTDQTKDNLKNWNFNREALDVLAYQKCIGIYSTGNIQKAPPLNLVLNSQKPYSRQEGIYTNVTDQYIELSREGVQKLKQNVNVINQKTVLINHVQQGSYVICETANSVALQWKQIKAKITGKLWNNSGANFLFGTKYVRILAMLNYNSGHPDYSVQNKQAQIDLKDIQWTKIK